MYRNQAHLKVIQPIPKTEMRFDVCYLTFNRLELSEMEFQAAPFYWSTSNASQCFFTEVNFHSLFQNWIELKFSNNFMNFMRYTSFEFMKLGKFNKSFANSDWKLS